ncbi:glycosyltransferase family 92 protein RCOM_0530710 [Morus notabilis]|uniref:glycosyltransferase family 92 protein RCOM_0530710 n=1 Tax=Morus notabilis TaxID=981085 RepID=UPI000CED757A|nr:glycosyltransferase family 92 protein RCOM_0530710 [Morus notabilis]
MDSEQRRKRKRLGKIYCSKAQSFSLRSLILCLSFFVFLLFLSSDRVPINPASFRPVISTAPTFFLLQSSNSILDPLTGRRQTTSSSSPARVVGRVLFPDQVLLLVVANTIRPAQADRLDCVYLDDNGSNFASRPVLSMDGYDKFRSIVRCPLPPANFSPAAVDLRWRGEYWQPSRAPVNQTVNSWDKLVYEAAIDGGTMVVFVKGLNLRHHRKSDPSQFSCHFGLRNWDKEEGFVLTTPAITAAQEVIRCVLPRSIQIIPHKAHGIRVTIGHSVGANSPILFPSVARIYSSKPRELKVKNNRNKKKHELCVCTMVWNQASALREWIMYHAWLGVEKWFIYDNNSDDGIEQVVQELDVQGFNVSRLAWPWIKTQEAGFSHCALRAREECNWVGFFDVDEFFYLPRAFHHYRGPGSPGQNALRDLVANFSSSSSIGEIRTDCYSFGPSGLSSTPPRGVTVGYTCRLKSPERHKSIVRPDMLDATLLNVVHHFELREGVKYLNVPENTAVVNHYKYQVWESFSAKFYRRVSTYVADWQEDQNKGSKDRAPGLGTEAIEPPNWRLQFCSVWDTGLSDFVLAYLADPATGSLPWEERSRM